MSRSDNQLSAKAEKFRTCKEALDRIRWDPSLDETVFKIIYEDRITGAREISFFDFLKKEDLLDHRILQIGVGNLIIWDKAKRIDLLFGSGITLKPSLEVIQDTIQKIQRTPISLNESEETSKYSKKSGVGRKKFNKRNLKKLSPIPGYKYIPFHGRWEDSTAIEKDRLEQKIPSQFTLVSFNILFDHFQTEMVATEPRIPQIFSLLKECDADFIALQEVTPSLIEKLLKEEWVMQHYYISEGTNAYTVTPYGQVLLSRYPLDFYEFQITEHKRLIIGVFPSSERPLILFAVHFTSDLADNALVKRERELSYLFDVTETLSSQYDLAVAGTDCFLIGDFNTREKSLDQKLSEQGFQDIWKTLYPEDPGVTFDPSMNTLAKLTSKSGIPGRLDRIWYRGTTPNTKKEAPLPIEFVEISRLGTEPISKTTPPLYLSDHYGLYALLENKNVTPISPNSKQSNQPVVRSALTIIPPYQCWEKIQSIRAKYDPSYARWMPHINLLYPFLPESCFEEVCELLIPKLVQIKPFTVTFTHFDFFQHRRSATVWLGMRSQPVSALIELFEVLQNLFPECPLREEAFTPHLTLARFSLDDPSMSELLQQWQKNWTPISFEVPEICLISRRNEEPFVVRKRVSLNCERTQASPFEFSEKKPVKPPAKFFTLFETITQKLIPSTTNASPNLYSIGSTRLGVTDEKSDLDLVCFGPDTVSREFLFKKIPALIKEAGYLVEHREVLDATIPLLEMNIDGQEIDFLYGTFPPKAQVQTPAEIPKEYYSQMDASSLYALFGILDAEALITQAQKYGGVARFQETLLHLKSWLQARAIHSQAFGYPGGFSWAILLVYTLSKVSQTDSPAQILSFFFQYWSQYNWERPVFLSEFELEEKSYKRPLMTIFAPVGPARNSTRNIIPSTLKVLQKELLQAKNIIEKHRFQKECEALLVAPSNPLTDYDFYLQFTLEGGDSKTKMKEARGWFEGHLLRLLVEIDKNSKTQLLLRPFPFHFRSKTNQTINSLQIIWLVGLESAKESLTFLKSKLSNILDKFEKEYNETSAIQEAGKIRLQIATKEELELLEIFKYF